MTHRMTEAACVIWVKRWPPPRAGIAYVRPAGRVEGADAVLHELHVAAVELVDRTREKSGSKVELPQVATADGGPEANRMT